MSVPVDEENAKYKGWSMRKTLGYRVLYGQMDDGEQSCQKMSEADWHDADN